MKTTDLDGAFPVRCNPNDFINKLTGEFPLMQRAEAITLKQYKARPRRCDFSGVE